MRNTERKTKVNLYERLPGEVAMIYEMGIPIVELGDDPWHVNVMQKVPLSRDRDNVNPSYLRKIRVGVLNAKFEELTKEDAGATWVREAAGSTKSTDEAVIHVKNIRFGEKAVSRDVSDIGSAKEAVSRGYSVIEGGSMSKEEWARVRAVKTEDGSSLIQTSAQVAPTDFKSTLSPSEVIPPEKWTDEMRGYAGMVERVAPRLINLPVSVQFIDNENAHIQGCFHKGFKRSGTARGFKREFGKMTVNLTYHHVESSSDNYELLLHELAHNTLCSNDHLDKVFYDTVTELGAKLAILALTEPKLFDIGVHSGAFTDVQPPWDAAANAYPEIYGEGAAT